MRCPTCSQEIPDSAPYCAYCGQQFTAPPPHPGPPPAPPRTSGMAVASFILGLLGALVITALAGLILGIISLTQIGRSQGRLRGQGFAIAGTVISGLALLSVPILAAMVYPVFARSRETARKAVCLSNVKNVSLAVQMYLADYDDTLPPFEHRPEVIAFFDSRSDRDEHTKPRQESDLSAENACPVSHQANPYLRWQVILDDYIRNREVWQCPSAQLQMPARFINGNIDWFGHLQRSEGRWGKDAAFCVISSWPSGWGGEVTDTLTQSRLAVSADEPRGPERPPVWPMIGPAPPGVFVESISVNTAAAGMRLVQVENPARFVICADGGASVGVFSTGTLAYPDLCALECSNEVCGWVDWETCVAAADCGLYNHAPSDGSFLRDPELRRRHSRHLGGVNIGFLDGHAAWHNSEQVIAESPTVANPERGNLRGYFPRGPTSDCEFSSDHPGVPTLY